MHNDALMPIPSPLCARDRAFTQVDVFTDTPLLGNPLAVVLDGSGLSDAQMQQFSRWTRLSETTFVLPPAPEAHAAGADYQVRIFTPAYEMPFAGHPTLGTCHAWLTAGGVPHDAQTVVQQCKVGLVRIRRGVHDKISRLAFAAPPQQRHAPQPAHVQGLIAALGLAPHSVQDAQQLCNGPRHFGLWVDNADAVLALQPDFSALRDALDAAGVTGVGIAARHQRDAGSSSGAALIRRSSREARAFQTHGAQPDIEVRFFACHATVEEDPVTGSFNASLAQWLMEAGHMPTQYVAAQGTCIGAAGRVHLSRDASGQVWVGGNVVDCVRGTVRL